MDSCGHILVLKGKKIYSSKELYKHDFMMVASDFMGLPDIIVAQ